MRWGLIVIGLVFIASPAQAAPTRFDFDTLPTHLAAPRLTGEPLKLVAPSGTVTIRGEALRVVDLARFSGDARQRGSALIDWRAEAGWGRPGAPMTIELPQPVAWVAISAGDFGGDADGPLELRAWDCAGQPLDLDRVDWDAGRYPPFARLVVRGPGICRVTYHSGGAYPGSTFVDDLEVGDEAEDLPLIDAARVERRVAPWRDASHDGGGWAAERRISTLRAQQGAVTASFLLSPAARARSVRPGRRRAGPCARSASRRAWSWAARERPRRRRNPTRTVAKRPRRASTAYHG